MRRVIHILTCFALLLLSCVSTYAGKQKAPKAGPLPANLPTKTRQLIIRLRKLDNDEAYDELLRRIKSGNKSHVKVLLYLHPDFKNKRDAFGRTPFFNAVFAEKFSIVKYLASKRVKLNIPDMNGDTPLHCAAEEGADKIVEFLIESGLPYYDENKKGRTPIFAAASRGRVSVVKFLIEHGDRVNRKDNRGDTPLHLASQQGEKAMVKLLISAGADENVKNNKGMTPLDLARTPEIKKILEKK